MSDLPIVSVFGVENVELRSAREVPCFETDRMDCRCHLTDDNLDAVLAADRPDVIVSFGKLSDFPRLNAAPYLHRRKWLHFPDTSNLAEVGRKVFESFMENATGQASKVPLVSVFTPAFNSGAKLLRPFGSLIRQTWRDWEWVVIDDSNDNGETFGTLRDLARMDSRIRPFKLSAHDGKIGRLKRECCRLAEGDILLELDHDDELTDFAIASVVDAFRRPGVGFVYTDFAECFEDGRPFEYGKGWGFGYGSYRDEEWDGRRFRVVCSPSINPKTLRHIVAAPNHIRAWRASVYWEVGGHSPMLHVADDYELMVRTFLKTRMCRVPKFCYIQYRNMEGNSHQVRNKEIQRLVRYISMRYDKAIHERFEELGVEDYLYREGEPTFWKLNVVPNPAVEQHCTVLA